jgi:hypothetical protein
MLRRILVAFCVAQPAVLYCQGQNYVAAALMVLLNPCRHASDSALHPADAVESAALRLLVGLSARHGLRDVWRPGLPRVRGLAFQLSEEVRRHVPLLHEHLARVGFHFEVLAAQWLLTLMAPALPFCTLRAVSSADVGIGKPVINSG